MVKLSSLNHSAQVAILNSDILTKNDDFYLDPKRKWHKPETRMNSPCELEGVSLCY